MDDGSTCIHASSLSDFVCSLLHILGDMKMRDGHELKDMKLRRTTWDAMTSGFGHDSEPHVAKRYDDTIGESFSIKEFHPHVTNWHVLLDIYI